MEREAKRKSLRRRERKIKRKKEKPDLKKTLLRSI